MSEHLIAEKDGAIGWLILDNPARRNAVSLAMWEAMPRRLADFADDPAIRVVVLKGAGGEAFSAGADISEFERVRATADAIAHYESVTAEASARLHDLAKPTVAMIHGFCVGGGVGLALDCDLRIAGDSARFGIPAARLGIGYDHAGVRRLMSVVGPAFAKEIFFTARRFTAAEALHMGLVNRVVADDELESRVRALCAEIADNAPLSLACIKTTVNELTKAEPDLAACDRALERAFASDDYAEGRRAFMEKRKPVFRGR